MRTSKLIKNKRMNMGLTQLEFAKLVGRNSNGERTVRGWENGEHEPSKTTLARILDLEESTPFRQESANLFNDNFKFTFIDLFAGIGGMRIAFQALGGKCIFSSEWDKFSQITYSVNFGEYPKGDITKIKGSEIPDHDILLAGFPCQAFSQAGLKNGFNDTRGTLFFDIQRILVEKRPDMFLLENVKQLKGHDKGGTLKKILEILRGENSKPISKEIKLSKETRSALGSKLNYWIDYKVLKGTDFGAPQNRQRLFIVGFNKDNPRYKNGDFEDYFSWPDPTHGKTRVGSILENQDEVPAKYTISKKLYSGHVRRKKEHKIKGNGFGFSIFSAEDPYTNTISARYYKDGSEILIKEKNSRKLPRKLTPRECARLQGFPEEFIVDAVSDAQAYRQFGNSVTVPVVRAIADKMLVADKFTRLLEKVKDRK
jgi:DNA (cytosine-5)-methyltransferase 1